MAKGDMVEKYKIEVDNQEVAEIVGMDAADITYGVVNIPGRDRTIPVVDGVKNIPSVGAILKVVRNSPSTKLIKDWFDKKQTKNMTVIRLDGADNEIDRQIWPNTELSKKGREAYSAETPGYARINIQFEPEDIIDLD